MPTELIDTANPKTFWMICNRHRWPMHKPRKMYKKLAEAVADQQALAKEFPGQGFYLLQTMTLEKEEKPETPAIEPVAAATA